jgi:hypothetical protein
MASKLKSQNGKDQCRQHRQHAEAKEL